MRTQLMEASLNRLTDISCCPNLTQPSKQLERIKAEIKRYFKIRGIEGWVQFVLRFTQDSTDDPE